MKFRFLLVLCLVFLGTITRSIDFQGYLRNSIWNTYENGEFYSIQNTFNLNIVHSMDNARLKINPVLYHTQEQEPEKSNLDDLLREAYIDLSTPFLDIRIGKQQIIWGKADGVFITDIVSPKNLTRFLLPDFEEIRMGITAIKFNHQIGNHGVEAIWIPAFTPNELPDHSSIWKRIPSFPITPTYDLSQKKIKQNLKNGEFFLKYSAMTSMIDFELIGGYHFDDEPAMHQTRTYAAGNLTGIILTPQHHRMGVVGGSFSATLFEGFVLRSEGAYYFNQYFTDLNPTNQDGLIKKNYLHYLAGIDFSLFSLDMSLQIIQEWIPEHLPTQAQDSLTTTMTFLVKKLLFRDRLTLEVFSYIETNPFNSLIKPKITYSIYDGVELTLGAYLFIGDQKGTFGYYKDFSTIYSQIKFSF